MQCALTLAVAEEALQFEHRDLHWGNLLIARQPSGLGPDHAGEGRRRLGRPGGAERMPTCFGRCMHCALGPWHQPADSCAIWPALLGAVFRLRGVDVSAPMAGVRMTLIDFTLSRLALPESGEVAFCDLAADPELFKGPKGDTQVGGRREGMWRGGVRALLEAILPS